MNPLKEPRILIGTGLVLVGAALVLMNVGMIEHIPLTRFWPMILIVMGMSKLFQAESGKTRWSGAWLLLLGIWFQLVTLRAFGMTYWNSWPLILIIWGIYLSGEALARRTHNELAKENAHGN